MNRFDFRDGGRSRISTLGINFGYLSGESGIFASTIFEISVYKTKVEWKWLQVIESEELVVKARRGLLGSFD